MKNLPIGWTKSNCKKNIQGLLDGVIVTKIPNLGSLSSGSDEEKTATQNLATLHKLHIEESKAQTEAEEKKERRVMDSKQHEAELALKEKQAEQQKAQQEAELSIGRIASGGFVSKH